MTISELLGKVGDENLKIQWLDSDVVIAKVEGKAGLITFATEPAIVLDRLNDRTEKVGVVVWMPRDLVERAIE